MTWMELSLDTTHEAVDWVCSLLSETPGIDDVRIIDYHEPKPCHLDEPPLAEPEWAFTLYFYLQDDRSVRSQIATIAERLSALHRTGQASELYTRVVDVKTRLAEMPDRRCQRIGDRFLVVTANEPEAQLSLIDSLAIEIIPLWLKPSFAFGSGLHPATILSLQLLERYVLPNLQTLDLGSGSGILSVAMAKLGAQVLALDNDRVAVDATQAAIQWNGVAARVTVQQGSLGEGCQMGHWLGSTLIGQVAAIPTTEQFDLIVANILARVHITLAHDFRQALRQTPDHPGILIASGFTTDHESQVAEALVANGFVEIDRKQHDEWVALAYRAI
ncbi:MAG: 50S ribosomal protein L11 methyltransferase [Scytolyngbya sp. HA4215-MV1]|jgi:ribosomal protein L11 methyltransferase|nr:50S ribosomal protein L11 methyltransferase [Scytolyngbya sp. HA4215-MV1]